MFVDHKKFVNDLILTPTVVSINSSKLDSESQVELGKLADGFKVMEISLISLMNEYEGNSIVENELKSAMTMMTRASNQASDIVVAEYNTLTKLVRGSKFEQKVVEGFTDITVRSVTVATKIASFVTEAVDDFLDGVNGTDDKSEFTGVLVTKLYIAMAKAISEISDICYNAERLANKLLNGLS